MLLTPYFPTINEHLLEFTWPKTFRKLYLGVKGHPHLPIFALIETLILFKLFSCSTVQFLSFKKRLLKLHQFILETVRMKL